MSGTVLKLIPTTPQYVPTAKAREQARTALAKWLPHASCVQALMDEAVGFVDQGQNFERVLCPACGAELGTGWWQEAMGAAYQTQLNDLSVTLPCCGAASSLNDLRYEWPAGFARFVLEAQNPGAELSVDQIHALEGILGCPLRLIWAHY